MQGDLRAMVIRYQEMFGREPGEISIGLDVAEALADELWDEQMAFRFSVPNFTRQQAMDFLLAGEMRFMGLPIAVETVFPTPEQAKALEGYKTVGPC